MRRANQLTDGEPDVADDHAPRVRNAQRCGKNTAALGLGECCTAKLDITSLSSGKVPVDAAIPLPHSPILIVSVR
jgi:hypothetical protein